MPKYDAFGREIGEDTLAGLGGSDYAPRRESGDDGWTDAQLAEAAAVESAPAADPERAEPITDPEASETAFEPTPARSAFEPTTPRSAFEPTPARSAFEPTPARSAFEPTPARTIHVRRRGGAGCLVALIVFGIVAAAPIIAIVGLVGGAREAIDEVTDALDSAPDEFVPAIPDAPAPTPTGIGGESLVARANFERTLDRLGRGKATMIRLAPERLDAQLARRSRQRGVQVSFDGDVTRGPATRSGGALVGIPLASIDPGAPARLVRGSAARFRVRPRGINYLLMSPVPGGDHVWIAYFKNGIYVQGDSSGRVVRRIS